MLDLSIIIVSYNTKDLLKQCLDSIYGKVQDISFEIFVVDNNSQDGSPKMVKNLFPKVKLIENKENKGFASANNLAIKKSKGRYVLLLNSDTIVLPGSLSRMKQFMDETPRAGATGCKLINPDGSLQSFGRGLKRIRGKGVREVDWVEAACFMVRQRVIDEIGLMDENFFFYSEDMDWCRRMRLAGWKIFCISRAKVIHYGRGSTRKWDSKIVTEAYKSGYYYARKHFGIVIAIIYRMVALIEVLSKLTLWSLVYFIRGGKEFADKISTYLNIVRITCGLGKGYYD